MPTPKQINDAFERMFRETCYACHNHSVSAHDCPPAEPVSKELTSGFTWGHRTKASKTGFIGCYASKLRDIVAELFSDET